MAGIVWIAAYPKSGNTWVRAFLHNLFLNPPSPAAPDQLSRHSVYAANALAYRRFVDKPAAAFTPEELAELRPKVHRAFMATRPDSVFIKTHSVIGTECEVPLITPECTAGAIYVVRNPLDICLSVADHFGLDIDAAIKMMGDKSAYLEPDAKRCREIISSWSHHVYNWTAWKGLRLHVLRYEDALERPRDAFGALVRFLGLPAPKARIDRAIEFASFEVLQKMERRHGFEERSDRGGNFFRVGRSGQWRKRLKPAQVKRIVADHRGQMARFDYLPR